MTFETDSKRNYTSRGIRVANSRWPSMAGLFGENVFESLNQFSAFLLRQLVEISAVAI